MAKKESDGKQSAEIKQKHGVPLLLSFFFPGLGQLVKGQILHAIAVWGAFFVAWIIFFAIPMIGLFAFPVVYFWNLYDAYNS